MQILAKISGYWLESVSFKIIMNQNKIKGIKNKRIRFSQILNDYSLNNLIWLEKY